VNTSQILNSKYPTVDSSTVELVINVVDGKSMDESKAFSLYPSILVAFSLKRYPTKQKHEKGMSELMPTFQQ